MRRLFLAKITNFLTKSRWSPKRRSSPKSEGFFWPKSQIFRPKAGDLQKKKKEKIFAEIRGLFLAEIENFNVFSAQKHQLFPPKKIPWGGQEKNRGGARTKIGGALPPCLPAGDAPEITTILIYTARSTKISLSDSFLIFKFHINELKQFLTSSSSNYFFKVEFDKKIEFFQACSPGKTIGKPRILSKR